MTLNNSSKRRKLIVTVIFSILLVWLYFIIFQFSDQDAEESGSISHKVSEVCVEIVNKVSGNDWDNAFREYLADLYEHPIRKLAHFSEYALMGILIYIILTQWIYKLSLRYGIVIPWVLLSAAADEYHQRFVQGRFGSIADVLLDTCGAVVSVAICTVICMVHRKNKKNDIK